MITVYCNKNKYDISINNKKLHEIKIPLATANKRQVCHRLYPIENFYYEHKQNVIFLEIPCSLALEIYRQKILSLDKVELIQIKVDDQSLGNFILTDFKHSNNPIRSDYVFLELTKES